MGRLSEARKRAQKKGAEAPAPAKQAGEPASEDVGSSDAVASRPSPKIELPPSGLAADVLGRAEVAAVGGEGEDGPPAPEPAPRQHSISFFATPAREEPKAAEATEHLATFFLDREEYGLDVRLVQEIRRVDGITQVPRAPEFIRGVMNLRGRIIPVVDLKRKLGLGEVALGRASRIVVVKLKERLIGLLVDGASQVLKVPVSAIEAPPEEVVEKGGDYIRGVAKLQARLIILVDLLRILARELGEAEAAPA
jgi:purine-binding chemotaxis protein CheW